MPKTHVFDENANDYDAWFDRNQQAYKSELEAVRQLLPRGGKGLEIGVGTGRFAVPLGVSLGVDPSPVMSKAAAGRGVKVVLGVGENLPYKEGSIDFLLMVTTVCFLDDVAGTLREGNRVLREGGYILIGFIDRASSLGANYERRKQHSLFYRKAKFLSSDELVSHLKQAGFRDFLFRQTLFGDLGGMEQPEPVKPGHGKGLFVIVRAVKAARPKRE